MKRTTLLLIALTFVSFVTPLSAITLSGSGQQASSPFNLQSGLAVFSITHSESSIFTIWLLDSQGEKTELCEQLRFLRWQQGREC